MELIKTATESHSLISLAYKPKRPSFDLEVGLLCEACAPPRIGRYEGRRLVLERVDCDCQCPHTIFEARGPRCPKCNHSVKIELTDRWEDPFTWINPKTHRPVKVDDIQQMTLT